MAEERNLGLERALDGQTEPSKAELQRLMERKREDISNTVSEIKDTVAHQVETVKDALDWREHFKRQPVAWSVGALGVGFLTGYCIAANVIDRGHEEQTPQQFFGGDRYQPSPPMVAATGLTPLAEKQLKTNGGKDHGPGLYERFKETSAYDRLSKEVGSLGDRLVDELSNTAQTVVLPALLAKVKDWMGLDLSDKKQKQPAPTQQSQTPTQQQARQSSYEPVLDRPS